MKKQINWGILGPGSISTKFATGLIDAPDAKLVAVGSRKLSKAQTFADKFGAARAYGSYAELVADAEVDVVYIGTPHSFHKEHTLLCLNAGKHVLCEKPFAINAAESAEMIALARDRKLFLMEAMWSRYLPTLTKVRNLITDGTIGDVRMLQADFGYRTGINPDGRHFDPSLGGGALLDVGIYPLSLAYMILGQPERIVSMADIGSTGVDEQSAFILGYADGQLAIGSTAIRTNTAHEAIILGTDGSIRIHAPWWVSSKITIKKDGKELVCDLPFLGNGYTHEAIEAGDCIRAGKTESDVMSLDETLQIMQTMDAMRIEWGMSYPME